MTLSETTKHLNRAVRAVHDIKTAQSTLDRLFFARETTSIAPPPENFFSPSYAGTEPVLSKKEFATYPDNLKNLIGKKIRRIRINRKMTQKDLSELTGIRRPNIARLERGQNYPNLKTLIKISENLEIRLEVLFGTSDS